MLTALFVLPGVKGYSPTVSSPSRQDGISVLTPALLREAHTA